jgi:hypothetical protein
MTTAREHFAQMAHGLYGDPEERDRAIAAACDLLRLLVGEEGGKVGGRTIRKLVTETEADPVLFAEDYALAVIEALLAEARK